MHCLDSTTPTTHTAHTHWLSENNPTGPGPISEEKGRIEENITETLIEIVIKATPKDTEEKEIEKKIEIKEETERKLHEIEQETNNQRNIKQIYPVKSDGDRPADPVNPLNGVDDRVFGPKMDLPRMGLKLLSSFENKEHATFGFVATTPLPPAFGVLEGES